MKAQCPKCYGERFTATTTAVDNLHRPVLFILCNNCHYVMSVMDINENDEIIERLKKLEGLLNNPDLKIRDKDNR
jgi:hypothetical protein